jgi:hypothetical protein
MPDRNGKIKGILVPAMPWERSPKPEQDDAETTAPTTREEKVLSDGRRVETDSAPESEKR